MKINVKSNFVVPGLDSEEFVDIDQKQLTIGGFLRELAERAGTGVEYVNPGTQTINPDEWEIRINDIPYPHGRAGWRWYFQQSCSIMRPPEVWY